MYLPRHNGIKLVISAVNSHACVDGDSEAELRLAVHEELDEPLKRIVPYRPFEDLNKKSLLRVRVADIRTLLDISRCALD